MDGESLSPPGRPSAAAAAWAPGPVEESAVMEDLWCSRPSQLPLRGKHPGQELGNGPSTHTRLLTISNPL